MLLLQLVPVRLEVVTLCGHCFLPLRREFPLVRLTRVLLLFLLLVSRWLVSQPSHLQKVKVVKVSFPSVVEAAEPVNFPFFVLEPDDLTRLCLGTVNGGLSSALFLVVNVLLWPTPRKLRFPYACSWIL